MFASLAAALAAAAVAGDARRVRVVRGGDGLADHLIGLLDAALDAGAHDGLAREALLLAHVDVGREDHGVGVVDDALRDRLVAARSLRLDGEVDAELLALRRSARRRP